MAAHLTGRLSPSGFFALKAQLFPGPRAPLPGLFNPIAREGPEGRALRFFEGFQGWGLVVLPRPPGSSLVPVRENLAGPPDGRMIERVHLKSK